MISKEKRKTILQVVVILLVAYLGSSVLQYFKSKPKQAAPKQKVLPVEYVEVTKKTAPVLISAFGTVEPSKRIQVRPQVSGNVIEVNPNFEIGGRIKKGEVLFKIDPRDYEIGVSTASAGVAQARLLLKQERGSQIVALREWELIGRDSEIVDELSEDLALRKPQLLEKEASLKAALGQLKKAKLDLERTSFIAPFDVLVISENVEVGQFLNSQSIAAELVATDAFYLKASLSRNSMKSLSSEPGGKAQVIQELNQGDVVEREGTVVRNMGSVDSKGRMAQILVAIQDPLSIDSEQAPILLGSYVKVEIQGEEISDVFEIPQSALREGSRVWVVSSKNTLEFKPVTVVFSKGNQIFVKGELNESEKIITTPLRNSLKGTALKPTLKNSNSGEAQ